MLRAVLLVHVLIVPGGNSFHLPYGLAPPSRTVPTAFLAPALTVEVQATGTCLCGDSGPSQGQRRGAASHRPWRAYLSIPGGVGGGDEVTTGNELAGPEQPAQINDDITDDVNGLQFGPEVVEFTEGQAKEEWLARGLDVADFSVEAMVNLWEKEDQAIADNDDVAFDDDEAIAAIMDATPFSFPTRYEEEGEDGDDDELKDGATGNGGAQSVTAVERGVSDDEQEAFMAGVSVGIDLGTTNSAVAVVENGVPVIIPNQFGSRTTPSIVSYLKGEKGEDEPYKVLVGELARRQQVVNPTDTYSSFKRLIGRNKEQARESGVKLAPLGVDKQYESTIMLKSTLKPMLTPQEVSSEVIKQLLADAEAYLNRDKKEGEPRTAVRRAVVTVPAYFDDKQCKATEEAGRMAGLLKVKLLREPQAAALAYGLGKEKDELVLVFDLGGGTFDVSILEVGGGVTEVVATCGDSFLGGDDFDFRIVQALAQDFVMAGGEDPRNDLLKVKRMKEAAEEIRIRLTGEKVVPVMLPFLDGMQGLETTMARTRMEKIIGDELKRLLRPVREVALLASISLPGETGAFVDVARGLDDEALAGTDPSELSEEQIKRFRKQQGRQKRDSKKRKAAERLQAEAFSSVSKDMGDGAPKLRNFPMGERTVDQVVLVGGATRMPCVKRLVAAITGIMPQQTVNPDEAVALGAAVYAAMVDGELENLDVMSNWQASLLRGMARAGIIY